MSVSAASCCFRSISPSLPPPGASDGADVAGVASVAATLAANSAATWFVGDAYAHTEMYINLLESLSLHF